MPLPVVLAGLATQAALEHGPVLIKKAFDGITDLIKNRKDHKVGIEERLEQLENAILQVPILVAELEQTRTELTQAKKELGDCQAQVLELKSKVKLLVIGLSGIGVVSVAALVLAIIR